MSFLGGILDRREAEPAYRTIDGGHPAPFPDMTDEQLYNYEVTFNVRPRTFSRSPRRSAAETVLSQAVPEPSLRVQEVRPPPERLRRNKAFDAPRYTTRKAAREATPAPIDYSKPVRTVTSKQPVEIVTTRARHPIYKVHAYIGNNDVVSVFTLDGRLCENGPRFLENVPQPRSLHLNIYEGREDTGKFRITQHATREEADAAAEPGRLSCVEVTIEA